MDEITVLISADVPLKTVAADMSRVLTALASGNVVDVPLTD